MVNGVIVAMTDAEITEFNSQITKIEAEEAANGYTRKRASEYPAIVDQLDEIYHNGIDSWKATIKTIKDKYPKP